MIWLSSLKLDLYIVQEVHDGLDLSSPDDGGYSFGIFSLKISTDGQEVVAGSSNGDIYVYDLKADKLSLRISAHMVFSFFVLHWNLSGFSVRKLTIIFSSFNPVSVF